MVRRPAVSAGGVLDPNGGVEYIALAFLRDFVAPPFAVTLTYAIGYGMFLALIVLGYALRIIALTRRHAETRPA